MSSVLRAVINSMAMEEQRILEQAQQIIDMASIVNAGEMPLYGSPSVLGGGPRGGNLAIVQATNEILDPQGVALPSPSTWSATGGALTVDTDVADQPPAGSGWSQTLRVIAAGGAVATLTAAADAALAFPALSAGPAPLWAYALVMCPVPAMLSLIGVTSGDVYASCPLPGVADGWTVVRLTALASIEEVFKLVLASDVAVSSGTALHMTGATICYDGDPGEPFSGDSPATFGNAPPPNSTAYTWSAGRGVSASQRWAPTIDILALVEQQANLNVAPIGQTEDQRRQYMLARFAARHMPAASVFLALILEFIQFADPSFTADQVRVAEHFSNYSFIVEIDYSPTAVLSDRVSRLITEIQPAHLKLDSINWGTFILSIDYGDSTSYGQLDVTPL